MKKTLFLAVASTVVVAGCAIEPDEGLADTPHESTEGVSPNGVSLNGVSLNGVSLNGTQLSGAALGSVDLASATLNGSAVKGVTLSATVFSGTSGASAVSGAGFVGSEWNGWLPGGEVLPIRIDAATQLSGPNSDLTAYAVSANTASGWQPLCGVDSNGVPVLAMPIMGTWGSNGDLQQSSTKYTFECRATAVAKCMELGYKPWKKVSGVVLQNHLVACTRMLRADYCGLGESWTVNGTPINLYDGLGIQSDTESWAVEAEWKANGATCVSPNGNPRYLLRGSTVPSCYKGKLSASCGNVAHFATGTLLIDEH